MVLHIFAHNFLNIQPIFNLKKFFEKLRIRAFQPYKCYVYWSMMEVSKVEITFNTSDLDSTWWYGWKALSMSFLKLFVDWKSVEY